MGFVWFVRLGSPSGSVFCGFVSLSIFVACSCFRGFGSPLGLCFCVFVDFCDALGWDLLLDLGCFGHLVVLVELVLVSMGVIGIFWNFCFRFGCFGRKWSWLR